MPDERAADPPAPGRTRARRVRLDASCRLLAGGTVVLGGAPLRLMRLSPEGARVVTAIRDTGTAPAGAAATGAGRRADRLVDRLVEAGLAHPVPDPGDAPVAPAEVVAIVPVKDHDPGPVLGALARAGIGRAVVVDDGSRPALALPTTVDGGPAGTVLAVAPVRHDAPRGPGGARQAALAHPVASTAEVVVFVDADMDLDDGWLPPLLAHLADPAVGAVAPRVRASAGTDLRHRYEARRSPLDLGPEPAQVRARGRVAYVPSALLVARRRAVDAVGGFDPALRFGEDVDLVWRLDAAGHRVRYEPAVVVHHRVRPDWGAFVRQRVGYGSGAEVLARRHPGAVPPVAVSVWSALAWALATLGGRRGVAAGGATVAVTTWLLRRKLADVPEGGRLALRLAGLGHLGAGRLLAEALRRPWWPLTLSAALVSRRARRVAALAVLPAVIDAVRDAHTAGATHATRGDAPGDPAAPDPVSGTVVRVVDDLAYGAGVWQGCLRHRSVHALVPDLRSWPGRRPPSDVAG